MAFTATQFYADIEGHPDEPPVRRALEELDYFTTDVQILGVYPRSGFRAAAGRRAPRGRDGLTAPRRRSPRRQVAGCKPGRRCRGRSSGRAHTRARQLVP